MTEEQADECKDALAKEGSSVLSDRPNEVPRSRVTPDDCSSTMDRKSIPPRFSTYWSTSRGAYTSLTRQRGILKRPCVRKQDQDEATLQPRYIQGLLTSNNGQLKPARADAASRRAGERTVTLGHSVLSGQREVLCLPVPRQRLRSNFKT
ncbi:hypothetical protein BHM03_00058360 [Ensete ventricosum]|nr:hypothetical protein BHM03_00058360 [Ensete ventricosum]